MVEELIKAYDEYIKLLENYAGGLATLASIHGMMGKREDVEKGELLRQRIKVAKEKVFAFRERD